MGNKLFYTKEGVSKLYSESAVEEYRASLLNAGDKYFKGFLQGSKRVSHKKVEMFRDFFNKVKEAKTWDDLGHLEHGVLNPTLVPLRSGNPQRTKK